ncbi:hypothetical protein ACSBR2_041707 [Camellia fascicularis]
MKGVGQRFAQGVVEFRDALSKYSIHSGFNFDFVKNDKDRVTVHCILTPERDIAFVTDRHGGLLKALAEVFPFSSHSFV